MSNIFKGSVQLKGNTAATWTGLNPILLDREVGIETDTRKFKFGNGVSAWNSLAYASGAGGTGGILVQEEGSTLTTTADTLNFVGAGVTASGTGSTKTVTILGGGDALTSQPISQLAATTSTQLRSKITDPTGTASLVFSADPGLTGTPTAPTAAAGTNTTQIATTAHVFAERTNTATLTNKTLTLPVIASISNSGTVTLPTGARTLVARDTTDTFSNKTFDTANSNSFSINGVSVTSNTGTGAVARADSPAFTTAPTAPTQTQADNSTKIATTAYADTLGATKATIFASVALTGANTLVQATHANRSLTWTGSSTAAQALPSSKTAGDIIDFFNGGTVPVTFTSCTAAAGYKNSCLANERFQAETDGTSWYSATPRVNNAIQALVDGATIATDLDISGASSVTLGGNRTLSNPTNPQDGGVYLWWITQDGTGSRTLALGSKFKKASADTLTLSTGINKVDVLTATYNVTKDIYLTTIKLDVS